ncbi:hypothetical protein [Streptomyces griseus]|uniref:hypothetical protein n=1 Tax=Streptomyces griseus TaxID=1911 RepID=UPI0013024446|nr:hypothetical protein [Streptomyces fimicarius]
MLISEVIARLAQVQEEHGDLVVEAYNYSDCDTGPVDVPDVETDRHGRTYVVLRP